MKRGNYAVLTLWIRDPCWFRMSVRFFHSPEPTRPARERHLVDLTAIRRCATRTLRDTIYIYYP